MGCWIQNAANSTCANLKLDNEPLQMAESSDDQLQAIGHGLPNAAATSHRKPVASVANLHMSEKVFQESDRIGILRFNRPVHNSLEACVHHVEEIAGELEGWGRGGAA